jgi:hypothetical protein
VATALPFAASSAPQLDFAIADAGPLEHAAAPTLRFGLSIEAAAEVRSVALNVEIRIAATRRAYGEAEQRRLTELFGAPEDWGRNLHALHWTSLGVTIPRFSGRTVVDLLVPCSYDLEVTGTKYLEALADGEIPLEFLFSGTVFYAAPDGRLQVDRIAWDREAPYRMPVSVWRDTMDRWFPGGAWLRLRRDEYERLADYRRRHTLLSWEDAIDRLLREGDER